MSCCFIFIHHTAHDSRRLALVNPVTGHTIPNPWEDPEPSSCGPYPCIVEPSNARQFCYWHGECCRLIKSPSCSNPETCPSGVVYHVVQPYDGQQSLQRTKWAPLVICADPSATFLRQDFFSAGADLYEINHKHAAIATELQAARNSGARPGSIHAIEQRLRHHDRARAAAVEALGQLARCCDLHPGLVRPGRGAGCDEQLPSISPLGRDPRPVLPWPEGVRLPASGVVTAVTTHARARGASAAGPVFRHHRVPQPIGVPPAPAPTPESDRDTSCRAGVTTGGAAAVGNLGDHGRRVPI